MLSGLQRTVSQFLSRVQSRTIPTPMPDAVLNDPHVFTATDAGSGSFGVWDLDEAGLPVYHYTLDQYDDARARYPNSENLDRRDHWHQIGNDRVTGLASNDGTVQVYLADRGGLFLNHYDVEVEQSTWAALMSAVRLVISGIVRGIQSLALPRDKRQHIVPDVGDQLRALRHASRARRQSTSPHSYVGGFGYIDDGREPWATAYRYCPDDAVCRRVFGMGYFQTVTTYHGIEARRTVYTPPGDDPVVIVDVELTSDADRDIRYYEYWDVNVHQMKLQWLRTGAFAPMGDAERRELNARFEATISASPAALRFHQAVPINAPAADRIEPVNWYPPDVFLADLSGTPDDAYRYTIDFFGDGDAALPAAVRDRRASSVPASPPVVMPYCMVLRRDLHLQQGQTIRLRFAYGAVHRDAPTLDFLEAYRVRGLLSEMQAAWRQRLAYFTIGTSAPQLQRETAWNAYALLSSTVYNEFFNVKVVPQGSAYLYLHGADGVPRDYALFAIPLTYLHPAGAKDLLRINMQMRYERTRQIGYAVSGYGYIDGASIHEHPSDLDLFLLLAVIEYLAATGDNDFLDERLPLYAPERTATITVLEHIVMAVEHLMHDIGRGENGLIRIRDGDWSDGVVLANVLRFPPRVSFRRTLAHGESVPNTQMALYVLPRTAALLREHRPELAAQIDGWVGELAMAAARQWTGKWYKRAVLRDFFNRPVEVGVTGIDLEAQPWALISGLAERQGTATTLIDSVYTLLDEPSPIGAPLTPGGAVWHAISQLLTWGYVPYRPDLAWRSFCRNTFYARATAFPDVWFNVWSGPDGVNGAGDLLNPGGTWASPVTPMTDFPATNNNAHAMSLLALLRVCGVEPLPDGTGLRITPHTPDRYHLDLPLLRLEVSPERISGEYRAVADTVRLLYVRLPGTSTQLTAWVRGEQVPVMKVDGCVVLNVLVKAGEVVAFEVVGDDFVVTVQLSDSAIRGLQGHDRVLNILTPRSDK